MKIFPLDEKSLRAQVFNAIYYSELFCERDFDEMIICLGSIRKLISPGTIKEAQFILSGRSIKMLIRIMFRVRIRFIVSCDKTRYFTPELLI